MSVTQQMGVWVVKRDQKETDSLTGSDHQRHSINKGVSSTETEVVLNISSLG